MSKKKKAAGESTRKQKRKQYSREQFLLTHKWCVYCGGRAVTTDHCPPRCFFFSRVWPETYEFPACDSCNAEARLDEQAVAVMIRNRLKPASIDDIKEWRRLVRGVANNQPDIHGEWLDRKGTEEKRAFRKMFGQDGDRLRHEGWRSMHLGSLSKAAIGRFMVKLGKALFYRHNETLFDGIIYAYHVNMLAVDDPPAFMKEITARAPKLSESIRGNQRLDDQFIYLFNNSAEEGVMYAVVQFSEQFILQIIAVSHGYATRLEQDIALGEVPPSNNFRHDCTLRYRGASEPAGVSTEAVSL